MSQSIRPDKRFLVAVVVATDDDGNSILVFHPPGGIKSADEWVKVPHTNVLLVGDVRAPVAGYIGNYSNAEHKERLGLHPKTLRDIRKFLGIAAKTTGYGGARPGSGRRGPRKAGHSQAEYKRLVAGYEAAPSPSRLKAIREQVLAAQAKGAAWAAKPAVAKWLAEEEK